MTDKPAEKERPEVPREYQETIRRCPVWTKTGPSSDPRGIVDVDWSPVLSTPGTPGQMFLLGWDPRLDPPAWVDEELQYAPAPAWAVSETYIKALELENLALKSQLPPDKSHPAEKVTHEKPLQPPKK